MVIEVKEITEEGLVALLEKSGRQRSTEGKNLAKHFGKLKRDIDGLEYQRAARYGSN
jgi:hypothetical protein